MVCSCDKSISNFLRNCHNDFHSAFTSFHSHQQSISFPFSECEIYFYSSMKLDIDLENSEIILYGFKICAIKL